jgi:hypothetical protein
MGEPGLVYSGSPTGSGARSTAGRGTESLAGREAESFTGSEAESPTGCGAGLPTGRGAESPTGCGAGLPTGRGAGSLTGCDAGSFASREPRSPIDNGDGSSTGSGCDDTPSVREGDKTMPPEWQQFDPSTGLCTEENQRTTMIEDFFYRRPRGEPRVHARAGNPDVLTHNNEEEGGAQMAPTKLKARPVTASSVCGSVRLASMAMDAHDALTMFTGESNDTITSYGNGGPLVTAPLSCMKLYPAMEVCSTSEPYNPHRELQIEDELFDAAITNMTTRKHHNTVSTKRHKRVKLNTKASTPRENQRGRYSRSGGQGGGVGERWPPQQEYGHHAGGKGGKGQVLPRAQCQSDTGRRQAKNNDCTLCILAGHIGRCPLTNIAVGKRMSTTPMTGKSCNRPWIIDGGADVHTLEADAVYHVHN